jgi:ankyrin repeat protein
LQQQNIFGGTMSDKSRDIQYLWDAALRDNLAVAKWAVFSGVDVNSPGRHGKTALHNAALTGSVDVAKFLLTLPQTKINQTDDIGNTPLDLAHEYDSPRVAKMIEREERCRARILREGRQSINRCYPKI